jgi:hypothetical protein
MVLLPSTAMATKLSSQLAEVKVPPRLIDELMRIPSPPWAFTCDQILNIRATGAFDGVHVIPVSRCRELAARLEAQLPYRTERADLTHV